MKKFVISVLSIAVFFVGLGSLADKVGAKFKSDEKALEIVRKARTAIGGDVAIAEVRSMTIAGRTTQTIKVDGTERSEPGETEIALQFPDKMVKRVKIGKDDGTGEKSVSRQHDVVIVGKTEAGKAAPGGDVSEVSTPDGRRIVVRTTGDDDATFTAGDGKVFVRKLELGEEGQQKVRSGEPGVDEKEIAMVRRAGPGAHGGMHGGIRQNEMLRMTLALLLTAPEGVDVNYTFGGESEVDGTPVNIINAEFGGANYKLFISRSSNLPVAMSYTGHAFPRAVKFTKEMPAPGDGTKGVMVFERSAEAVPSAENFVRFSDYRSTGGIQLPYKWTTTIGGAQGEVFDVTSYEVNPANIAEKFGSEKVFVRKPVQK